MSAMNATVSAASTAAPAAPATPRLTSLSHGGGCGCKIAPGVLSQILAQSGAAAVVTDVGRARLMVALARERQETFGQVQLFRRRLAARQVQRQTLVRQCRVFRRQLRLEAGEFVVEVGTSSRNLPLSASLDVDAPRLAADLPRDSTLEEWMADPYGAELLRREVAGGQGELDPELVTIIGNMPMSTLANFGGMSLDHDALDRVALDWKENRP